MLQPLKTEGAARRLDNNAPRMLQEYRNRDGAFLNMTLKVMSIAPKVYEINNFLSDAEVEHILKLAQGIDLRLSSTGDSKRGEEVVEENSRRTRTSYNSWVPREKSPIIDSIYRRAADLMRIDEALLRHRSKDERPDVIGQQSMGEQLQLVHYDIGQEYTVSRTATGKP
jgi:prolyl 4-hydroxylase